MARENGARQEDVSVRKVYQADRVVRERKAQRYKSVDRAVGNPHEQEKREGRGVGGQIADDPDRDRSPEYRSGDPARFVDVRRRAALVWFPCARPTQPS